MKNLSVLIVVLMALAGCAVSGGKKIDQEALDQIKVGETTKAQVTELMGAPQQVTRLGNGDSIFTYVYVRSAAKAESYIPIVGMFAGGSTSESETATITFGSDNVVKDIAIAQSTSEMSSGIMAGQ